jgi:hypothetical protein
MVKFSALGLTTLGTFPLMDAGPSSLRWFADFSAKWKLPSLPAKRQ